MKDNRYYILDFARTMPPEHYDPKVDSGSPRQVYYHLLRPEFVRRWMKPLCSDALTRWQDEDPNEKENNEDLRAATKYLREFVVTNFAKNLDKEVREGREGLSLRVGCHYRIVVVWLTAAVTVSAPAQQRLQK